MSTIYTGVRPRLLDLYCCAGGAGMGYARAGFVMKPGVGEFKSRHQRVYMTLSGAQEIADALNARDAEKRGER